MTIFSVFSYHCLSPEGKISSKEDILLLLAWVKIVSACLLVIDDTAKWFRILFQCVGGWQFGLCEIYTRVREIENMYTTDES